MNLMSLKYAVEIGRTLSISRAAENLYMSQPNLSRAIKELEAELGIVLFTRSTKGITVTRDGEAFLRDAARIVSDVERVEALYRCGRNVKRFLRAALCPGVYLSRAVRELAGAPEVAGSFVRIEWADTQRCIELVGSGSATLGVVRAPADFVSHFVSCFEERKLCFKRLFTFESALVLSNDNPLSRKRRVTPEDLKDMVEFKYFDTFAPGAPPAEVRAAEWDEDAGAMLSVGDCALCLEAAALRSDGYVWAEPAPDAFFEAFGLRRVGYGGAPRLYVDLLISRNGTDDGGLAETLCGKLVSAADGLAEQGR